MVRKLNIVGDAQSDLVGHGGEQRAVLVYQVDSSESEVRIGDRCPLLTRYLT